MYIDVNQKYSKDPSFPYCWLMAVSVRGRCRPLLPLAAGRALLPLHIVIVIVQYTCFQFTPSFVMAVVSFNTVQVQAVAITDGQ